MTPLAFRGLLISLSRENKHSETDVSLHVFFIDRPSCIIFKVYPPHAFTNWIVSVNLLRLWITKQETKIIKTQKCDNSRKSEKSQTVRIAGHAFLNILEIPQICFSYDCMKTHDWSYQEIKNAFRMKNKKQNKVPKPEGHSSFLRVVRLVRFHKRAILCILILSLSFQREQPVPYLIKRKFLIDATDGLNMCVQPTQIAGRGQNAVLVLRMAAALLIV